MTSRPLLAALRKLRHTGTLASSQCTPAQRQSLDAFARQTGAIRCQRQGRGDTYRIADLVLFDSHLKTLSPQHDISPADDAPVRARHIALARDSKARGHQHASQYLLLKGVGTSVHWHESRRNIALPLSRHTEDFGAASVRIEPTDHWKSEHPLWLIENQALFDRTDWLPAHQGVTLLHYTGQLTGTLLDWLAHCPRASHIMHFPDYDGVGLLNFSRLYRRLGPQCAFWLMPDWQNRLTRYGSAELWRRTLHHLDSASPHLPAALTPLVQHMRQSGLALEQEAVWLD